MTIDKITITNFQAHSNLEVEFADTLTTIIGPSDVGKSAILRALRWVCTNLPAGDAFIQEGSDGAVVAIDVDGHRIVRERMKNGVNRYFLDDTEYVAFGNTVPDAIKNLLKVDKINFVGQKEPDFWFSLSPSEVSRQLNTVVDLGVIDDANERMGKRVWQGQEAARAASAAMQLKLDRKNELEWIQPANNALGVIEGIVKKIKVAQGRIGNLQLSMEQICTTDGRAILKKREYLALEVVRYAADFRQGLRHRLQGLSQSIAEIKKTAGFVKLSAVDFGGVSVVFTKMQELQKSTLQLKGAIAFIYSRQSKANAASIRFDGISIAHDTLLEKNALCSRLVELRTSIIDLNSELNTKARLHKCICDDLHEMSGEICPVCGSKLDKNQ